MAAIDFWTRAYVDKLIALMMPAFGQGAMYNVHSDISNVIICGDLRRDPDAQKIKHLCLVGVVQSGVNVVDTRAKVSANIQALYPGATIKTYKLYSFIMLPDGTGRVSWLVVPEEQAGAATLHATGPVTFIKMIEMFAESRSLTFGASGLKTADEKLVTRTETDLFEALGAKFVPLHERDVVRYVDPL